MSEPARRRIRAQGSPGQPLLMRFILEAPVQEGRSALFENGESDAPLAQALFAIEGVRRVQVSGETVLITRTSRRDWDELKAPIAAALRQVLDATGEPLGSVQAPTHTKESDAALLRAVNELLDSKANPSIASHGGEVTAESVENGNVYIRMGGGCQGCASSALTLRRGVETILRAALPQIAEIVDITDHASGENPFYKSSAGQSPSFHRAIPPDHIGWEDGELVIDPDYLAPRLGLTPDALHAGLAAGSIIISSEARPKPYSDQTRVVARSRDRAWAADILPDGSAREVPPPRQISPAEQAALTFPRKVRAYLESLPAESIPITYGQLARGLGMYAPGSVRKVTAALEDLMREDSVTDRPFIAARVVGRGAGGIPRRGFFDLARTLGRMTGESEREFHERELSAGLAPQPPALTGS